MGNDGAPVAARTELDPAEIKDDANLHVQVTGATKRFHLWQQGPAWGLGFAAIGLGFLMVLRGYDSAAGWFSVSTAVVLALPAAARAQERQPSAWLSFSYSAFPSWFDGSGRRRLHERPNPAVDQGAVCQRGRSDEGREHLVDQHRARRIGQHGGSDPLARRAPLGGLGTCLRIGEDDPGHPLTVPAQEGHDDVPAPGGVREDRVEHRHAALLRADRPHPHQGAGRGGGR